MSVDGKFVHRSGGLVSVVSTDFNSLANGSGQLSATVVEPLAETDGAYWSTSYEFAATFGSAPTAGGGIDVYACVALDGTNYERTVNGATPGVPQWYLGFIPIDATTSAQRKTLTGAPLMPHKHKIYVVNRTGQAFPSSVTMTRQDWTDRAV